MAFIAPAIPYIVGALSVAGAGYAAYNSYQQGKATQSLNNYNAAVSDSAAKTAESEARAKANAQRAQAQRIKARQRALYARAGVNVNTGTPLVVQTAQAGELEMSALEIQQQGNVEAARQRNQAVLDRMAGKSAYKAGATNAGATILQGISSAASSSYSAYTGTR